MQDKRVVSPFEFALMETIDPEGAKNMRPETDEEKRLRLKKMAIDFAKRIRIKS